jgi:hypothetical protein
MEDLQIPRIDRPRRLGRKRLVCQMGGELKDGLDALSIYVVQTVPEDKNYALKAERSGQESTLWNI